MAQAAKIGCRADGYRSLLKPQKEGFDDLFRTKLTYDNGKTPVKIFDETRRGLDAEEIAHIRWRESEPKVLLWIKGCYVQSGQWGPLAHVEAIMVRQGSACPFDDAEEKCEF